MLYEVITLMSPLILTVLLLIFPAFTTIGAMPLFLVENASIPSCFNASKRGCIGLFLIDSSPVSTAYPFGIWEEIPVRNNFV